MNKNLPIIARETEILSALENNSVVIITAETGSGKTTQVPQMTSNAGYYTTVTEPRRLVTRSIAKRVADELGVELGTKVGFNTAFERNFSRQTNIMFVTDGLQLVKELGGKNSRKRVLIIDEAHESNLNIEVLLAWSKKQIKEGSDLKVIVMSATLDVDALAEFYGKSITACINVEGRMHKVVEEASIGSVEMNVQRLVNLGHNVLVFEPGKREIEELRTNLNYSSETAVVLPLHSELPIEEQDKVFKSYDVPKVVIATNIAQTSITIPDIDAVVDTALEKRIELLNGIEQLVIENISKADAMQRKGRAGRTKEGVYVYCNTTSYDKLDEYISPDIERLSLESVVLRLADIGIDAENFEFFHQPSMENIKAAKDVLLKIGAMDHNGNITDIGKLMTKMPTSVRSSRMLVEAKKRGVLLDMVDIVSIYEVGGIRARVVERIRTNPCTSLEFLSQLKLFQRVQNEMKAYKEKGILIRDLTDFEKNFLFAGVNKKAYYQVLDVRSKLIKVLSRIFNEYITSTNDVKQIKLSCMSAFIDHIYFCGNNVFNETEKDFIVDNKALVYNSMEFEMGLPKIINFIDKRWGEKKQLKVISWPIVTSSEELEELNADLIKYTEEKIYDIDNNSIYIEKTKSIGNHSRIVVHDKLEHTYAEDFFEAAALYLASAVKGGRYVSTSYPIIREIVEKNENNGRSEEELKDFFYKQLDTFDIDDLYDIDEALIEQFVA